MKILIAVSSKEYSGPTLQVGIKVAKAFNASTTIVDVGEKISEFSTKAVGLARERMESWDFDRPGIEVLEWAFSYLAEKNFIEPQHIEAGFPKNTFVDRDGRRGELYLKGTVCDNVNLILRNGDIIAELRDEVQTEMYDVTIIGGSGERRMAHDMVQYIDSSIFIVKNFDPSQDYRILLAVDDSPGTRRAIKYGARVAQAFNIGVDILTVSKNEEFRDGYKGAAHRAAKFLRRSGIDAKNIFKVGDPSDTIVEIATNNHIIIMGASTRSPLKKFFIGSKPLDVMENCSCPILIIK
jgi:nucleotide-binding universal stress UspA family protein